MTKLEFTPETPVKELQDAYWEHGFWCGLSPKDGSDFIRGIHEFSDGYFKDLPEHLQALAMEMAKKRRKTDFDALRKFLENL